MDPVAASKRFTAQINGLVASLGKVVARLQDVEIKLDIVLTKLEQMEAAQFQPRSIKGADAGPAIPPPAPQASGRRVVP